MPRKCQADPRGGRRAAATHGGAQVLRGCRPFADPLELRGRGGTRQDLLARDAFAQHLAGRRHVAELVDPSPSELERGGAQRLGDPVHLHLGRKLGLRRAKTAERAVWRRVRCDGTRLDAHVFAPVWAARVERAARQHHRRQGAVRPTVHHDLDVLPEQSTVPAHAAPVLHDRRMALRRGGDVLVAVVDHPHRAAALEGQQRRVQGDHRRVLLLPAEAAAGLRLDDLSLSVVEAERPPHRFVDVVGALQRAVYRDAAVLAGDGDHRLVLDVELLLVADPVRPLDDQVGARQRGVHVAGADVEVGEDLL